MNAFLYAITVAIWGGTWVGIHFQVTTVEPIVSLFYRNALAALLMLAFCALTKKRLRFSLKQHFFIALQGFFLFGLNYLLLYESATTLESGLVALLFSSVAIMNIFNGRLFMKKPINGVVLAGSLIGLVGVAYTFAPDLFDEGGLHRTHGVLLCLGGAYLASLGNILSAYNQSHDVPVNSANALALTYASIFLLSVILLCGQEFQFDGSASYVGSLIYLSVLGTIVAFYCYLTLLGRIGADRAVYAMLLFPILALVISSVVEGLVVTRNMIVGSLLVLAGNYLVMAKPQFVEQNLLRASRFFGLRQS